jgi:hypothetical protein
MSTLRQFSEKDKDYFAYQAQQNYLRQQMSVYRIPPVVRVNTNREAAC